MLNAVENDDWQLLGSKITANLGIKFGADQVDDLKRRFQPIFARLSDAESCQLIKTLIHNPRWTEEQITLLASALTVGETYFFRDKALFVALQSSILPALFQKICLSKPYVQIWSAACCTGEEPYSIAMLANELGGTMFTKRLSLFGTDLNPHFLAAARKGIYSSWSMRTTSAEMQRKYFTISEDAKYVLKDEVKSCVSYSQLNLIDNHSLRNFQAERCFDIIFCRNVLIYFSAEQTQNVISNLFSRLAPDGLLVLSPHDVWCAPDSLFERLTLPGVVLLRKRNSVSSTERRTEVNGLSALSSKINTEQSVAPRATPRQPSLSNATERPLRQFTELSPKRGFDACCDGKEFADTLKNLIASGQYDQVRAALKTIGRNQSGAVLIDLINALAERVSIDEAHEAADEAIKNDPLHAAFYFAKAQLYQHSDDQASALSCLRQAIFLDQDFVVGHFTMGTILGSIGKLEQAEVAFNNAIRLLKSYRHDQLVPFSDGLSAASMLGLLEHRRSVKNG